MVGADCWTDHRLVRSKLNMHIMPLYAKRSKKIKSVFNVNKFQSPRFSSEFQDDLDTKFNESGPLTGDPKEKWSSFKDKVTESAKKVLGPKKRHN